jgi:hypothetical protein
MDQLKGKSEVLITLRKSLTLVKISERYVKKIKTTTGISNGHI